MSSPRATEKAQITATLANYTLTPPTPQQHQQQQGYSRPGLGHTRTRSNPPPGLTITPAPYRTAAVNVTTVTQHQQQSVTRPKSSGVGPKNEKLWNPHDDAYWAHLREMWATSPSPPPSTIAHTRENEDSDAEELDEVDLRSAKAIQREFRVQLPNRINEQTRVANFEKATLAPPPPPPPYTRRPSHNERTLGGVHQNNEEKEFKGTATCKYLFWIGFIFPLTWLFGAIILFTRARRGPSTSFSPSTVEQGPVKRIVTTKGSITIIAGPTIEEQREAEEIKWGKRCSYASIVSFILYGLAIVLVLVILRKSPQQAQVSA